MSKKSCPPAGAATDYFTVDQVAAIWQCSPTLIYDLLTRKKIRAFKIGASWRIRESAMREYEEIHTTEIK